MTVPPPPCSGTFDSKAIFDFSLPIPYNQNMKHITRTLFVIGVILLFTMNLQLGAEIYKLVLDGPIDTISEEYIVTMD